MSLYLITILSISILFLINFLRKKNFFVERISNETRKLHSKNVTRIGGLVLISYSTSYFYILDDLYKQLIIFSLIIFLIGFIEDIFNFFSAIIRFLFLLFLVSIFIYLNDLNLSEIDNSLINTFILENIFVSYFFTILCLILLINGFNFIDGANGLMLGYAIISVITLYFFARYETDDLLILLYSIFIPLLVLFLANLSFGQILSGDGGSYLMGFLIGSLSIILAKNYYINSFVIACLLFYPVAEVSFSFLRRVFVGKSPLKPDGAHLHQLIFNLLTAKFQSANHNTINSATSLIILSLISLINIIIILYYNKINFALLYLFLNIFYIFIYLLIFRKNHYIKNS